MNHQIFTVPNAISLMRLPLALLFIKGTTLVRAISIILAMLSDGIDGYYARRFSKPTALGTMIDPLADKVFVIVALAFLFAEQRITWVESAILISRDFSVLIFGIYLIFTKKLMQYQFRAIWCGKVTTVLQFLVLLGLTLNIEVPSYLFGVFIILGVLALLELYFVDHTPKCHKSS